jgi:hypothetical protein
MPALIGTLIVNHRGKKLYVIDGQHRLEALRTSASKTSPASSRGADRRRGEAVREAADGTPVDPTEPRFTAELVAKNDRAFGDQEGAGQGRHSGRRRRRQVDGADDLGQAAGTIHDQHGDEHPRTCSRSSGWRSRGERRSNDIVAGCSAFIAQTPGPGQAGPPVSMVTVYDLKQRSTAPCQGRGSAVARQRTWRT